jgi:transcriptional regulator with GAF, ATPase, and Fis domain
MSFIGPPQAAEFESVPEMGETTPLVVEEWSSLSVLEGRHVEKVLIHTGGNKQAAARILDVDRKTLDRMIKRHKISVGRVASFPPRAA